MSRLSDARGYGGLPETPRRLASRLLTSALIAAVVVAALVGLALGLDAASNRAAEAAGPELARVLRFMAAIKDGLCLGVVGLVAWRLRYPATAPLAVAAIAASAVLAAGSALV